MKEKIDEGKTKIVYATEDPGVLEVYFKDDATALNGKKHENIEGKGEMNARITESLLRLLERGGVPTHFLRRLDERTHQVRRLEMIRVEVVLRNVLAGSLAKKLGRSEGEDLPFPVVEFYLKDDALGDPFVNDDHVVALGLVTRDEVARLKELARGVNGILKDFFAQKGIRLVDFKLEFGRADGTLYLGDEISPDTCRLWDIKTGERLDKDRFRRDLGHVADAYSEVLKRVEG